MKRLSLLLLLTVVLAAAILGPARLAALGQTALYSTAREAARFWAYRSLRDNLVYEGTGYRIYFEPADEEVVGLVAQTIEKYRGRLSEMLRAQLPEVTVVIHPDQASLAKALGWEHERNAVGVYWAGLIRVLSPKVYIADPLSLGGRRTFERQGPMVHELTHLIMDYHSAGNYPRWFTEGVAQYVERELTGYEWISPRVDLTLERYSLRELTTAFDRLTGLPPVAIPGHLHGGPYR